MKNILTAISFFTITIGYTQDSTNVESPIIIAKLLLGSELKVDNVLVKFIDVINDSRCPKNVNCVRAGEAKVLVEVYMDNKLVENKVIEITPTTHLLDELPVIFSSAKAVFKVFNLLPYPESGAIIKKEDYFFQLVIEN